MLVQEMLIYEKGLRGESVSFIQRVHSACRNEYPCTHNGHLSALELRYSSVKERVRWRSSLLLSLDGSLLFALVDEPRLVKLRLIREQSLSSWPSRKTAPTGCPFVFLWIQVHSWGAIIFQGRLGIRPISMNPERRRPEARALGRCLN